MQVPTHQLRPFARAVVARKNIKKDMNPEGFEPPTFGSGIRRAAVAPWVRDSTEPGPRLTQNPEIVSDRLPRTK